MNEKVENRKDGATGTGGQGARKTSPSSPGEDVAAARKAVRVEAESAAERASRGMEDAKAGARDMGREAAGVARSGADRLKSGLSSGLEDVAQAVTAAAGELEGRHRSDAGRLARSAAEGIENLAQSLNGSSIDEVVDQVRGFGRRNPTAFIAGAVLAGLALGRFVQASGTRVHRHSGDTEHGPGRDAPAAGPAGEQKGD